MSEAPVFSNPFETWAELTRGLKSRFIAELQLIQPPDAALLSPHSAEFVGSLAGLITECEHMSIRLHGLERHDLRAYKAFISALEKS